MITSLILAGGESSRLYPLGDKSLQRFLGKTLMRRHLVLLRNAGIRHFVIVTNPANDAQVRAECSDILDNVTFVMKHEMIGMGYAAALGVAAIDVSSAVLVTAVHDILDPKFYIEIVAKANQQPETILLAARHVQSHFPGGYLVPARELDTDRTSPFSIVGIVEKPEIGAEPSDWITLLAHFIPHAGMLAESLRLADAGDQKNRYERALTSLTAHNVTQALPHTAMTASLKFPWHMLDIMEVLLHGISAQRIHSSVKIAEGALVRGPVIIAEGVQLFPGSTVIGPAYIGPRTSVGENCRVRESMLGAECMLERDTEVAHSWVGNNVRFHTNQIGYSVIDSNVRFGTEILSPSERSDQELIYTFVKGERICTMRDKLGQIIGTGARIESNAALMPGIIVGRNAFVGRGVVLNENGSDAKYAMDRQQLDWGENSSII